MDYRKMYFELFKNITDAINLLQTAQIKAEQVAMAEEEPVILLDKPDIKVEVSAEKKNRESDA